MPGDLELFFQPIIPLGSSNPGMQAEIVTIDPESGPVPASGQLTAEGSTQPSPAEAVALRWIGELQRDLLPGLDGDVPVICLRISPHALLDPESSEQVLAVLDEQVPAPEAVAFEISPTTLGAVAEQRPPDLESLLGRGLSFVLGDFGQNGPKLRDLGHLPVREVKVDIQALGRLNHEVDIERFTASVIEVAKALNYRVTAKGLIGGYHLELARSCGVDAVKGDAVQRARPVRSSGDLKSLLDTATELCKTLSEGDDPDETVGIGEAAEALGLSTSTVRRLVDRQLVTAIRTDGGHRRIRRDDLIKYAQMKTGGATLAPIFLPDSRAPVAAALLEEHRAAWIGTVVEGLYQGASPGAFRTLPVRRRAELMSSGLARLLAKGRWSDAATHVAAFLENAMAAGATSVECARFTRDFFGLVARESIQEGTSSQEARALRRLADTALEELLLRSSGRR